jgi:hypothetical protein
VGVSTTPFWERRDAKLLGRLTWRFTIRSQIDATRDERTMSIDKQQRE